MELQQMKYKNDSETHILVCAVNPIILGGEYTVCGNAIPDTTMEADECEHIGDSFNGKLKDVTCQNCIDFIKFFKRIK